MSLEEVGFLLNVVDTVGSLALLSALVWAVYSGRGVAAAPLPPLPVSPPAVEVEDRAGVEGAVVEKPSRRELRKVKRREF